MDLSEVGNVELDELVSSNSAFAFDLYHALSERDGNLFFSPYSLSLALAMTYAGARDETAQQMAEVLRFTLPQERLHPAFHTLEAELARRGEGARGQDGEDFRLNVANALWAQEGYGFLAEYIELVDVYYGAGWHQLDFTADPEAAREVINEWVETQTEERIRNLIPSDALTVDTRLVLTNAIYFNAAWQRPFDEALTEERPFTLLDGSEVMVPTMRQTAQVAYASGKGYQALELPYDGEELTMVILLPDEEDFEAFEAALELETVRRIVSELAMTRLELFLPKFEFTAEFSLSRVLSDMGMPLAFSDQADFSGMNGRRDLSISEVLHKAFVLTDEAGTEAAAATGVVVGVTSVMEPPPQLKIDRPFIFLIRDLETNAILFVGRVLNPLAEDI